MELTSSTRFADRSEPSPNLFSSAKGGNSHSIKGNEGVLGLSMAALTESIARRSLFDQTGQRKQGTRTVIVRAKDSLMESHNNTHLRSYLSAVDLGILLCEPPPPLKKSNRLKDTSDDRFAIRYSIGARNPLIRSKPSKAKSKNSRVMVSFQGGGTVISCCEDCTTHLQYESRDSCCIGDLQL